MVLAAVAVILASSRVEQVMTVNYQEGRTVREIREPILAELQTLRADLSEAADNSTRIVDDALGEKGYALFDEGGGLLDAGQFREAEKKYIAAMELLPPDRYCHINLGMALARQDRVDDALFEWNEALRIEDHDTVAATAHYLIGVYVALRGDLDGALEELSEAKKLDPQHVHVRVVLGAIRVELGQWDLGLAEIETARDLDPRDGFPQAALSLLRRCDYDFEGAIDAANESLRLAPHAVIAAIAHHNRGLAFAYLGEAGKAEAAVKLACQADPTTTGYADTLKLLREGWRPFADDSTRRTTTIMLWRGPKGAALPEGLQAAAR